jgi:hypothetical protein
VFRAWLWPPKEVKRLLFSTGRRYWLAWAKSLFCFFSDRSTLVTRDQGDLPPRASLCVVCEHQFGFWTRRLWTISSRDVTLSMASYASSYLTDYTNSGRRRRTLPIRVWNKLTKLRLYIGWHHIIQLIITISIIFQGLHLSTSSCLGFGPSLSRARFDGIA